MKAVSQAKRYRERRAKLGRYLLSGEVVEDHFHLRCWIGNGLPEDLVAALREDRTGCGTTACIAGFCPVVFPRSWRFALVTTPVLRRRYEAGNTNTIGHFAEFFGLPKTVSPIICAPVANTMGIISEGPFYGKPYEKVTAADAGRALLALNEGDA